MHLGTSTILLAFSLFGNLCGSQKQSEPPPDSTADRESTREYFTRGSKDFNEKFADRMATIALREAKYQDKDKELTAEAKKAAIYPVLVQQHDKLVARTEALKAEGEAHAAFIEAHKQDPSKDDLGKLTHDDWALSNGASDLIADYDALSSKVQQLVYDSR